MIKRILKKDFQKNKGIAIVLFIFITLSSLLVASGVTMITDLTNSINTLFTKSNAPDFVQMHAGEINHLEIEQWASNNELVKSVQTVEMINIDGTQIDIGEGKLIETNSLMDNYFVKQNESFDYLLDLNSEIIHVSQGEIAVPIYYMQQNDLNIGDPIQIGNEQWKQEFVITHFVRDVQMNPSIIHSKRFIVHEEDLEMLKYIGEMEYSIEFLLNDRGKLNEFRNAYESSNLPNKGPVIDYPLFQALNALTDGLIAAVIILVSILLNIIAILCIRYTILGAMEEDYKEIGIMKAIGLPLKNIKRIYFVKYVFLAAIASVVGYLASLIVNKLFTSNMALYLGTAPKSILLHMIPILAVIIVLFVTLAFCLLTFRRFNKISAVEALRFGSLGGGQANYKFLSLHRWKLINVNVLLGIRDNFARFKTYIFLLFVFVMCSFIIIVPLNFLNTVQSPSFIKYMGFEKSDLRIDLQQSENMQGNFNQMIDYISNDKDVEKFSPLVTSRYKFLNDEGTYENITIESGDYTKFPLEYLEGHSPVDDNEIALSYMNSDQIRKGVGDQLNVNINGEEKVMVISGIYQDVTNGGRTAKAVIPYNPDTVLWYEVSLDLTSTSNLSNKIAEYEKAFYPAKVTDLNFYLSQTFGNTIQQLKTFTIVTITIALLVSILITSLFLRMLVAKDSTQIAIMKSIGFSLKDIRIQYVTTALSVLAIGIILGTVISNVIGESIVSLLLSFMGVSQIQFVINPIEAYILCPIILLTFVAVTTLFSISSIEKSSIVEIDSN